MTALALAFLLAAVRPAAAAPERAMEAPLSRPSGAAPALPVISLPAAGLKAETLRFPPAALGATDVAPSAGTAAPSARTPQAEVPAVSAAPAERGPEASAPPASRESLDVQPPRARKALLPRLAASTLRAAGEAAQTVMGLPADPVLGKAPASPEASGADGRVMFDGATRGAGKAAPALAAAAGRGRGLLRKAGRTFGVAGGLAAANTAVFAALPGPQSGREERVFDALQGAPGALDSAYLHLHPLSMVAETARAFSGMFLHMSTGHLLGNMIALLLVAPIVQWQLGAKKTLLVYFAGGLASAVVDGAMPGAQWLSTAGASTCIMGLVGALVVSRIWMRNFATATLTLWAKIMLAWILVDAFINDALPHATIYTNDSNVDKLGHSAGAFGGLAAAAVFMWLRRRAERRASR